MSGVEGHVDLISEECPSFKVQLCKLKDIGGERGLLARLTDIHSNIRLFKSKMNASTDICKLYSFCQWFLQPNNLIVYLCLRGRIAHCVS